jgi:hypothetical protein
MLNINNGHLVEGSFKTAIEVVTSDPLPVEPGKVVVNSSTGQLKVCYLGRVNVIGITITPG